MTNKIKDATYWADKIRYNEITPEALLKLTEEKIELLNPKYNAIIAYDRKKALADLEKTKSGFFCGRSICLENAGTKSCRFARYGQFPPF